MIHSRIDYSVSTSVSSAVVHAFVTVLEGHTTFYEVLSAQLLLLKKPLTASSVHGGYCCTLLHAIKLDHALLLSVADTSHSVHALV
jgi:hypothetical protein